MIRFLVVSLFLSFFSLVAVAQNSTVKGVVRDGVDKLPVAGASVLIFLKKDSTHTKQANAVTNIKGGFELTNLGNDLYIVEITSVGYETLKKDVVTTGKIIELGNISFTKKGKDLEGVTIVAKAPPVIQKGDTSEFSASQFKVNPDATTEDLIKKMPGITVDKDGTVTAQGEQVKKVTIDGKDFFGDDASAALKNLPSEVVDKIQVFDRLSDQSQLTGFDDGNSVKALNIVTKSGIKNGQFGRLFAGYGTDDRYSAGGNISFFKGTRRISLVGNFNNINQQNFGSQDLLGLTSSGGRGGGQGGRGGGQGGRGGGGGGTDNFTVGQSNGISNTNAFGINYSDQWTKKLSVTGSYFYNKSNNDNQFLTNTQTISNRKNQISLQNGNTFTDNSNHRINLRFEYKLDSSNSIFIIPSINFQNNNSNSLSAARIYYGMNDSISTSNSKNIADRLGFNIRNNIMFRHSFKKRGRSISVGLNTTYTKNDGENYLDAHYRFFKNNFINDSLVNQYYDKPSNGNTIGANIAYTEPIGKKGQIQIDYTPSVQHNLADQQTFSYDGSKYSKFDTILSNKFENTITTHNAGINYRLGQSRDEQLSFGVNIQNSRLESLRTFPSKATVNQSFSNILPNLMWRKKLSATTNVRIFYRTNTNFPSVGQLQDVADPTNPLRISIGNPKLTQSYTHLVAGRYMYINSKTSHSFFANLFLQTASDYISNATFIPEKDSVIQPKLVLNKGGLLTKPVNLNGYKSLRTFFTYSMPIKPIKTTVNVNAGFSYAKLPGLANYLKTITNNYSYNTGVVLASNVSEYVDFNLSYSANFSTVQTIATVTTNSKYVNQSAGIQVNLLSKKGWFIQNDVANQTSSGLSAGFNQSYWLWNAAIGKKFGKKKEAEFKLSVFDLLKQNQSIVRTVTGSSIEDAQNKVLTQYFLLTFSYSLRNFGVAAKSGNRNEQYRDGMRGEGMRGEGMNREGGGMNPNY